MPPRQTAGEVPNMAAGSFATLRRLPFACRSTPADCRVRTERGRDTNSQKDALGTVGAQRTGSTRDIWRRRRFDCVPAQATFVEALGESRRAAVETLGLACPESASAQGRESNPPASSGS